MGSWGNVEQSTVEMEESVEKSTMETGTPPFPFGVLGSIQESRCPLHLHVEWDVGCEVLDDRTLNVASPAFYVGSHLHFLNLRLEPGLYSSLSMFGLGRPLTRPVRWWAGFRYPDGACLFGNFVEKLLPREEFGSWARVSDVMEFCLANLQKLYLGEDRSMTVFFRMSAEPTGEGACTHGAPPNLLETSGSIREERCPSHTHVEWDVGYDVPGEEEFDFASPVFQIGSQLYYLRLYKDSDCPTLFTLSRYGRSAPGSFLCWAGLRFRDGTYPVWGTTGELDLQEDLGLWTELAELMDFSRTGWEREYLTSDRRLTFFFRLNVDPTGEGACTHDLANVGAKEGVGSIRNEDCPSHRYLEWEVTYSSSGESEHSSTSPVFEVGSHRYQMCLGRSSGGSVRLELFWLGRSTENTVRCWAGLKQSDGTHRHQIQVAELHQRQESSLWTEAAYFRLPGSPELERNHLTSDGRLVIFLRMDGTRSTTHGGRCTHDAAQMRPRGEGVIRQKKSRRVQWNVACEAPREHDHLTTSPSFWIGDQCYLLELLYETDGVLTLSLYRSGRPVEGRVQCWAGHLDITGTSHTKKGAELDLSEDSELWTRAAVLGHFRRCDPDCAALGDRLTFFFRVDYSGSLEDPDGCFNTRQCICS